MGTVICHDSISFNSHLSLDSTGRNSDTELHQGNFLILKMNWKPRMGHGWQGTGEHSISTDQG